MKKIVFLCSAGGSTMKFLYWAGRSRLAPGYAVVAVISDRDSAALDFAERNGLPAHRIEYTSAKPRELQRLLERYQPDVIVTNFYKLLDRGTVKRYGGKLVNLHYSLLPSFKGFRAVPSALEMGCKLIGATVHLVDDGVDAGTKLAQCAIPVDETRPNPKLMDILFRAGCLSLLASLDQVGRRVKKRPRRPATVLPLGGRPVLFSPGLPARGAKPSESFWRKIRKDGDR